MHPTKSLSPDRMSPLFYQKYWTTMGPIISKAVLRALNSGNFPPELNYTHITLIPKKHQPTKVVDFRPISLYNVLFKLISKVIANRLRDVLLVLISDF